MLFWRRLEEKTKTAAFKGQKRPSPPRAGRTAFAQSSDGLAGRAFRAAMARTLSRFPAKTGIGSEAEAFTGRSLTFALPDADWGAAAGSAGDVPPAGMRIMQIKTTAVFTRVPGRLSGLQ